MLDFKYSIPTEIYFGRDSLKELSVNIKKYADRILLVYGGGSVKRIGLYDKIVQQLKEHDITFFELANVEPNPRVESVREGVRLCREHDLGLVLAVGGGSVIDASKVIAGCVSYEGDPWEVVLDGSKISSVLPVASVLMLSATGSEMNRGAVISNMSTNQKYGVGHPDFAPKFSVLNPEHTFSVPPIQMAAGTADIMSHVFEVYFDNNKGTYLQDRMAEAVLKTCIHYGPIAVEHPDDYTARANLMWASSLGLNGLLGYGRNSVWTVHPMEHELSAYFDITHGIGLAILTPHWMRYVLNADNLWKFKEYGIHVWNIDPNLPEKEIAERAITCTSEFFKKLGIPMTLKEVGVTEEKLPVMAKAVCEYKGGAVGGFVPLKYEDVLSIYKSAY